MAETLFPQRLRCKKCRGNLGKNREDTVLFGLYCSPKCAGVANPATDPGKAPRECVTQRDGAWQWKRAYRSESEIPDRLKEDVSTSWYWCSTGHLHIGHTRMGAPEKFRGFRQPADISDVLVKARGKATVAQVAKVAGVRPIRLKELEAGTGHLEGLTTLFKVCQVLGIELGASFSQRGAQR